MMGRVVISWSSLVEVVISKVQRTLGHDLVSTGLQLAVVQRLYVGSLLQKCFYFATEVFWAEVAQIKSASKLVSEPACLQKSFSRHDYIFKGGRQAKPSLEKWYLQGGLACRPPLQCAPPIFRHRPNCQPLKIGEVQ